jgi:tRNA 2-thiouridine synthesizing protein A
MSEASVEAPIIVEARGHRCPTPTLRLRRAMEAAGAGRRLTLLADDPMARIDAPHLVQSLGGQVVSVREVETWLEISVETPHAPEG